MEGLASVIIVTYNHKRYLEPCITSVLRQDYPHEIIVVDNCSQDGGAQFIIENFPTVKVIKSSENKGYGAGNNLGVKHAKGEYIVILNPDTVAEDCWLEELISPLEDKNRIITTPKILLYDGSAINTCGNDIHFTGLAFTRGLGSEIGAFRELECVSEASGCCLAIRKEDFYDLGGFDENIFLYHDDVDFSCRAHLKGYDILYVPTSVVRHDYTLNVTPEKIYHLEKGRYMILRKYFSKKYFLLLFPSLVLVEFLTFGYAIKYGRGGLKYKLKAMKDGLTVKVNGETGDKSKLFQALSVTIPTDQLTFNRMEKVFKVFANKIFAWNFKVVK